MTKTPNTPQPTPTTYKPCPFCGSDAVLTKKKVDGDRWSWRVECSQRFNNCPMNMRTHHAEFIRDAEVAWNTRSEEATDDGTR